MTRAWVRVDYPNKKHLSRSEAMGELKSGPSLEWYKAWISSGDLRVTPEVLKSWQQYELVHVYYDAAHGRIVQEAVMYDDTDRFRWALGCLYSAHTQGRARCCRPGNEHLGTYYFVYPARPYIELEKDEDYYSPIGALRFHPRKRGLL